MTFDGPRKNDSNSHSKRPRGRTGPLRSKGHNNHSSRNSPGRNVDPRTFNYDSNGPEGRVKGNAQQLVDKYTSMARDASSTGDWVLSETCLQYADHYARLIKDFKDSQVIPVFLEPVEKMAPHPAPQEPQEFTAPSENEPSKKEEPIEMVLRPGAILID